MRHRANPTTAERSRALLATRLGVVFPARSLSGGHRALYCRDLNLIGAVRRGADRVSVRAGSDLGEKNEYFLGLQMEAGVAADINPINSAYANPALKVL